MKTEHRALLALSEEDRAAVKELLTQWKLQTWLTFLVMISAAVAAAFVTDKASADFDFAALLLLWMIPAALVLCIILSVQERIFRRKLTEIPALQQTAALTETPPISDGTIRKTSPDAVRIVIAVILCILCFPAGLCYLIFIDRQQRTQAAVLLTAGDVLNKQAETHTRSLGCLSLLCCFFAGCYMLLRAMMGSVAISKLSAMNQTARGIANAANTYLAECDDKGKPLEMREGTYIVRGSDTFEEGSLEWGVTQYVSDVQRPNCWYALQVDSNGIITAAWYAKHPLTESELQPTDNAEQRALLASFTHQDEAVGYYAAPTETPSDD